MLSESQTISRRHASSSAIHEALNPIKGIRDEIARKGGTPKNHAKENMLHLKSVQRVVKEKQLHVEYEKERKTRIPKNPKYSHIPSRLYLSTGKLNDSVESLNGEASTNLSRNRKSELSHHFSSDFLPPSTIVSNMPARQTRIGQVPKYLKNRKEEWTRTENAKRQQLIEEATWPAGTVPVPESERVATLKDLKQAQKTLLEELSKFPITLQPSQFRKYQRKMEVEAKLAELDKDIELYSQTRVFVAKP